MGHSHAHLARTAGDDLVEPRLRVPAPLRAVLVGLVAVSAVAAVAVMVLLWPGRSEIREALPANPYQDVRFQTGTVSQLQELSCAATSADRLADGTIPQSATCVTASVRLVSGPAAGDLIQIQVPVQVERAGLATGDRVRVALYPATDGEPSVYAWAGYDRGHALLLLAGLFVVAVVAVARLKGLAALAGIAVAYPMVALYFLPALRLGESPILVALSGCTVILIVVLYLAHGVSVRTTVALLGTLGGLAMIAGLAWWATSVAHLDGLSSENNYAISRITGSASLGGIILCGVILAGLGVLNDVTVAQVSSVWELRAVAPHLGAPSLFASGLRIGRDHLASTVYTVVFAYAGAALPALMLIDLYQQPLSEVLIGGEVAEEIVRTLVAGTGLVLAIPLTTLIAAAVAASARPEQEPGRRRPLLRALDPALEGQADQPLSVLLPEDPPSGRRSRHRAPLSGTD
jgi:uncharacterized membrane protein